MTYEQAMQSIYRPFPFEEFARIVGGHNWVVTRRTPRIIATYGEDVICLSRQQHMNAERLAYLAQTDGFD